MKKFVFIFIIAFFVLSLIIFNIEVDEVEAATGKAEIAIDPAQLDLGDGESGNVTISVTGDSGVTGFTLFIESKEAVIESIGELEVVGEGMTAEDFKATSNKVEDGGKSGIVSYATQSVDKGVAQGVKIPLKIKKSSKYKGSILVNAEKAEVTAQSDSDVIDYEIIVKNSTELAGEEKNSGGGSASGECGAYWVIGDINCSGGKPDEKDYQAWKAAFSPHIDGGAASLPECTSAGNINADVNSDGKVDLKDFEVWRKGANGTQTNPAMTQWPEACR